jgi:anti-sigma regulatory factor (Ser/Thr protein kinase)
MGDQALAELRMMPDHHAPEHARRWLRDALADSELAQELVEDSLLVVDELVTNAVVHAGTPIVVTVEHSRTGCECAVTDQCTSGQLPHLVERLDGTGRGLRLVDALSSSWAVERSGAGTTVRVAIRDNDT